VDGLEPPGFITPLQIQAYIGLYMSLTDRFSPAQNRSQWMAVATAAKATRIHCSGKRVQQLKKT